MLEPFDEDAWAIMFWIKLLLILLLNIALIDHDVLRGPSIALFNLSVLMLWFALAQRKITRLYQKNLLKFARTSKSAETPGSREQERRNCESALKAAIRGVEVDVRCS